MIPPQLFPGHGPIRRFRSFEPEDPETRVLNRVEVIGRVEGPDVADHRNRGDHSLFCQGQRPVSSTSSVKLRKVRMSTMMANVPTVSKVNSTATV